MTTKEIANQPVAKKLAIESWMPTVIPTLRENWSNNNPTLKMSDWLALLHNAAVTPSRIPYYLGQLFKVSQSQLDPEAVWLTLPQLFTLTSEAMQEVNDQLNTEADAWQTFLIIQNRIWQSAGSLVKEQDPLNKTNQTQQAQYLKTVTNLDKVINNSYNSNELLDKVTALIQHNFDYNYVTFFSLNEAKQTLALQSASWQDQQPNFENRPQFSVNDSNITARAAATGQTVVVNNFSKEDPLAPPNYLPNIKSQLSIPLLIDNNLLGVLDIAGQQENTFSQDDPQILQALVGHIAVAIENVRLQNAIEHYSHEQKLLYESNMALGTTLNTDTVLKLMTQKITEALEAGACTICKIDPSAKTITNQAEYILRHPGTPSHTWRNVNSTIQLSKDPIATRIVKTGRPVIEWGETEKENIWQSPSKPDEVGDTWGTVLALPLKGKKNITGIIEIYDKSNNRSFSNDDIQLCQLLATQTTLALERAQLFEETRRRLNEVSTLYTMAQDITATLDLQSILDSIVISLRHVLACRGCCIFLLDPTEQTLEIKAADGLKPQWKEMAKLKVGEGAAGRAVETQQTIYIPNTHKDPSFIFFDENVYSLLVIPLKAQGGEIIGTINLDASTPDAFGPAQEQLLTIAAAQAGIAIENARLFAKIATEQQQTQAIIQYMADGLLVINDLDMITTCNPALAMMLGMHTGQIVGKKVGAPNLHPNLASITGSTTKHARTGVLAKEVTIDSPRRRTLQVFSTVMVNDIGKPVGEVRVVHDVTRERELEQLKEDFMSTISHELRTPLFSIQGFVQILMEEEELDETSRNEFLSIIQTQAIQLGDMVNNLLDASKFDEGKMKLEQKPVAILDVIQQTLLKLQGFAHQQKVNLTPKLPGTLPAVMGDKERLEQLLTNLIGNAIKFTPEEGQVTVTASTTDNKLLVEVQDTGPGISFQDQEYIFSRYSQAGDKDEGSKKGSGLGLYIAKEIIKSHNGHIWVESRGIVGQGSTFRFTLPLPETPVEL